MRVSRKIIAEANKITSKYSKWIEPKELQNMYKELDEIGVSVGTIYGSNNSCEWYYEGDEVDNSLFISTIYKDYNRSDMKNEYTIYFS